jgi:hypothetical protein
VRKESTEAVERILSGGNNINFANFKLGIDLPSGVAVESIRDVLNSIFEIKHILVYQ